MVGFSYGFSSIRLRLGSLVHAERHFEYGRHNVRSRLVHIEPHDPPSYPRCPDQIVSLLSFVADSPRIHSPHSQVVAGLTPGNSWTIITSSRDFTVRRLLQRAGRLQTAVRLRMPGTFSPSRDNSSCMIALCARSS